MTVHQRDLQPHRRDAARVPHQGHGAEPALATLRQRPRGRGEGTMPNLYQAPCTAVDGPPRLVGVAQAPRGQEETVYEGVGRLAREGAIQGLSPRSRIEAPPPPPTKWPTPPTACTRRRSGASSASVRRQQWSLQLHRAGPAPEIWLARGRDVGHRPPPDRLRRRLGQGGHCGRRCGPDCRCVAGGVTSGETSASSVRRAGEG